MSPIICSEIFIEGLDKAEVLAALYDSAKTTDSSLPPHHMSLDEARLLLDSGQTSFDDVLGRAIQVDLKRDTVYAGRYDAQNGFGTAKQVIEKLRANPSSAALANGVIAADLDTRSGVSGTTNANALSLPMDEICARLENLSRYICGAPYIDLEFGSFLSKELKGNLSPEGFVNAALKAVDSYFKIEPSTADLIEELQATDKPAEYMLLLREIPRIAEAVCPSVYAAKVQDHYSRVCNFDQSALAKLSAFDKISPVRVSLKSINREAQTLLSRWNERNKAVAESPEYDKYIKARKEIHSALLIEITALSASILLLNMGIKEGLSGEQSLINFNTCAGLLTLALNLIGCARFIFRLRRLKTMLSNAEQEPTPLA